MQRRSNYSTKPLNRRKNLGIKSKNRASNYLDSFEKEISQRTNTKRDTTPQNHTSVEAQDYYNIRNTGSKDISHG